jgi:hypothetical protein
MIAIPTRCGATRPPRVAPPALSAAALELTAVCPVDCGGRNKLPGTLFFGVSFRYLAASAAWDSPGVAD